MKKNEQQQSWLQNTSAMLVLYSILSATCGVFIIIVIQDHDSRLACRWEWPIALLSVAFFLFLFAAEAVSEAVDQEDMVKFIATHVLYNVGVVLLIGGISSVIYFHYNEYFYNHWLRIGFISLITLASCFHWLYDTLYLIFISNEIFDQMIKERGGNPKADRSDKWGHFLSWTKGFLWLRRQFHKKKH